MTYRVTVPFTTPFSHPGKGELYGTCNRSACPNPNAFFFNHATRKYYCTGCAKDINAANPEGQQLYGHALCTPYIPERFAHNYAELPPLTQPAERAAELVREGRFAEAETRLRNAPEAQVIGELSEVIDLPFPYTYDVEPLYVAVPESVAQGTPEYELTRGRVKPEVRAIYQIFKDLLANEARSRSATPFTR